MFDLIGFVAAISVGGLIVAFLLTKWVLGKDTGTEAMRGISDAIKEGANAFVRRQYTTIAGLTVALAVIMFLAYYFTGNLKIGIETSIAFMFGAFCSGLAGIIGMLISVRSNIRVASASTRSTDEALKVALRGGAVSAITIVSMSLIGVTLLYVAYNSFFGLTPQQIPFAIVGFGFGASFVALFAQLGGGIYTKAADVGADLAGKLE